MSYQVISTSANGLYDEYRELPDCADDVLESMEMAPIEPEENDWVKWSEEHEF